MSHLLLAEVFPPRTGGSGRWFWEIYRRLPSQEIVVAAGEMAGQEEFDASHAMRIIRLPLSFPSWGVASLAGLSRYRSLVARLQSLVQHHGVHRIHCGKCLPEGFLAWWIKRRWGVGYLVYVHGEELASIGTSRELRWMTRQVLRGADFVIANSRHTQLLLHNEWQLEANRIHLFYPGVDTCRFVPAPRDDEVRDRLGWAAHPVVLTVGRLQRRKGQDQLIRALSTIRRRVPDVLYAIVGDGEERQRLESMVIAEGVTEHVQFYGEMSDAQIIECYQQCDLFALPNREVDGDFEGFGMVLLEAQACGRPVLAGTSGGTSETMRVPETGRLVGCDEPEPLAEAVIELLLDPKNREQMGSAARRWVVEHFDWESLSKQAQRLFELDDASSRPTVGGEPDAELATVTAGEAGSTQR
jgi:phosphatidyl-myo-inositol dimannoside synthase